MFAEKALWIFVLYFSSINVLMVRCNADVDSVRIIFYYGPTYDDYKEYPLDNVVSVLEHPKFVHKQTTCYMPGYGNTRDDIDTRLMVNSYLKRNTTNFLKLDWEKLAGGSYLSAQENVLELSPQVADSIIELFMAGLDQNSFSLCGLSMGARGISVIGQHVIDRSNGNMIISRISPLDPSNEEAHDPFILPPIEKCNAKFVDVIHSDAGGKGTSKSMGHADFWPNNGTSYQPGCDENTSVICSHAKALVYWAESVANANTEPMLAYRSKSYEDLLENGDDNYMDTAVLMGIDCPLSARGDYYLEYSTEYGEELNYW